MLQTHGEYPEQTRITLACLKGDSKEDFTGVHKNSQWHRCFNHEVYAIYKEPSVKESLRIKWAGVVAHM